MDLHTKLYESNPREIYVLTASIITGRPDDGSSITSETSVNMYETARSIITEGCHLDLIPPFILGQTSTSHVVAQSKQYPVWNYGPHVQVIKASDHTPLLGNA